MGQNKLLKGAARNSDAAPKSIYGTFTFVLLADRVQVAGLGFYVFPISLHAPINTYYESPASDERTEPLRKIDH